jgi:hypothetical protein
MPKVTDTRKQRAAVLRTRLARGPAFSAFDFNAAQQQIAIDAYRLWAESWILPELDALVPELRKKGVHNA